MRTQNGFTLVEALVVGIIGSILAGMFIAFMYVHNDAVNRGVARAILLTQSEIVSSRIAAAVRSADGVFAGNESWSANPQLTKKNADTIVCFGNGGNTIAVFRLGQFSQRLYEGTGFGNLKVFKTGRDTVTTIAGSSFMLSADRRQVTLDLRLTLQYRGKTYSIPSKKDAYQCRN
jgi:type II secretory pathway pseudopilin PulG